MTTPVTVEQLHPRLADLTVIDVRSPGEYATGHVPGAHNVPLDRLDEALPALRAVAARGGIAVVCASGNRSRTACDRLAAAGVTALTLTGGTSAWAGDGHPLDRVPGARAVWAMDRQVRLVAGSLVLAGVLADLVRPGARWISSAVGAGLAFSALTDTCALGNLLGRLPHNRPRSAGTDLEATLAGLRG
ncbi:rhodanese-like domain-containing protein [Kitasatospora sp. DSM 101779]|uniref:rhodanese-like domain-containing protein n=1 Tax=Kitasatospora sp. DSM 101779 TaxID=2853165 RepID=UPI0021D801F6|nr:rhodanese-like domain-containing protein [Kitasatospora sp. DSM 101779]MCU7826490.1 rhodanese-like domain-containing protein [Kitasatospora sp. DSM 101779]